MQKGDIVIKIPSENTVVTYLHWKDIIEKSKMTHTDTRTQNKVYTLYEVTMIFEGRFETTVCLIDLSAKNDIVVKQSVAKESDLRLATPYEIAQWKLQGKNKRG